MTRLGIEQQYLASLRQILDEGEEKHPERKLEGGRKLSHYTKGVSCLALTHYMDDGFPLFTTRKLWLKNTAVELEGFIKGITDKKWFEDRGCPYWRGWANPIKVKEKAEAQQDSEREYHGDASMILSKETITKIQEEENDLGPIYGYQWRNFNKTYPGQNEEDGDFSHYADQFKDIVQTLKTNPNDRRMVCSAWNPNQFDYMSLLPCHICWGVTHWNGKLDLWWTQRSVDMYAGLSANISSYALLLLLLAKESGFKANKLTFWGVDCHLYSNQFENAKIQIEREPLSLPIVNITGDKSIFDWTYQDFQLLRYQHYPALEKVEVVV